jgi:putative redox protein
MDAKVNWKNGITFTGTADSGFSLTLGTGKAVGGQEDGFRPMELFAIGLAGCTAMDVISILNKKRQEVTGFEVNVHLERAEDFPKVFTSAVIEYLVTGHDINEIALKRAMDLSATRYCPAQAMFGKIMPIELKYQIFENRGRDQPVLVKSGVCQASEAVGAAS